MAGRCGTQRPIFCQDPRLHKFRAKSLCNLTNKIFPEKRVDKCGKSWYNNNCNQGKQWFPTEKGIDTMNNSMYFARELELIVNEELRMVVKSYLDERVPAYFWQIGASSSGKFHPVFSQGWGGLVRHTKAVVMFAEELLRMSSYAYMKDEYKDYVIAACIIHDTAKYGTGEEMDKKEYKNHAENAAILFNDFAKECDYQPSEFMLNAVRAHMGQWSTNKEDRPFTNIDRCVHMADYMASRSFIDIPCIVDEYEQTAESELPF
jgi:HD superfamily phosphohydrolase YqeK